MLLLVKELPLCLNFGVGFKLRSRFGIKNMIFGGGFDKVVEDGCNQERALQLGLDGDQEQIHRVVVVHRIKNGCPSPREELAVALGKGRCK